MAEFIEREAAKEFACEQCGQQGHCNRPEFCPVMCGLDTIPAADVAPVRHGRYIIDDMGDSSCSECGERYLDVTKKYCPNCGALMDKEDTNG